MFGRDSGDVTVLCPFDNTHVILSKSLNSHLVKCRKNYQHLKKVPCKFDRTHMILKPELQHHHSICPSRLLYDRELQMMAGTSNTLKGDVSGPEIRPAHVEDTEEDWDAGPRYVATNALFSSKKRYMEEEEEEEDYDFKTSGRYDPSAAASSISTASSSSPSNEENFRRVPLAPSKAAQLSAPVTMKPKGSSSLVYEYSLKQAALGRGRGRAPAQTTQTTEGPNTNAVRPTGGGNERFNTASHTTVSPPHLGRGIARFATQVSAPRGRGAVPGPASMPPSYNTSASTGSSHQYPAHVPQPAQFEDSEDLQAQTGGTSSAQGGQRLLSLEDKIQALLLRESLENAQEMEQLKLRQELRHQQLLEQLRQEQEQEQEQLRQQQQEQQLSATFAQVMAAANQASKLNSANQPKGSQLNRANQALRSLSPSLTTGVSDSKGPRGRGRGVDPSTQLRTPKTPSAAQTLHAQMKSEDESTSVDADEGQQRLTQTPEGSAGVKENSKEDFSKMTAAELTKVKRKQEKKLKQISVLEKKVSEGAVLTPEEVAKLKKKASIQRDLEKLSQYL